MDDMQEYKYLRKYIKMVGLTFLGKYMEDFLVKYDTLKNDTIKEEYIHYLLLKEKTVNSITAMRMKVDNMLKIINMGYEKEALAIVIESNYIKKNNPDVLKKAQETLEKIMHNKIINN